jgi:glycosyltransferase involved in cell wall biosynthesis
MTKKIIYFFPHNPYPPRSGAHKRCLEILTGLCKLGYDVTFTSATISSETEWNQDNIDRLEQEFGIKVLIYEPNFVDWKISGFFTRFYKLGIVEEPLDSILKTPIGMQRWFTNLIKEISPDIVLTSYCFWDRLLKHKKLTAISVVDTIDLYTINIQMHLAVSQYMPAPPIKIEEVNDRILQEDFFENLSFQATPEELEIYDRYDRTIAIARNEFEIIEKNTKKTSVSLIPMTQDPCYLDNQYTDLPIFTTGPNIFNTQGYLYFVKRVLPQVLAKIPEFELQVTGACCDKVTGTQGIKLSGFVPDLNAVYKQAKFLICPVFGGTGQQVKIVEAMAHGLPAVVLQAAAKMSPLEHGVNGFIARNATEFAEYVIQLWQDPELCRKFGTAARAKIASEYSAQFLLEQLSLVLQPDASIR